MTQRQSDSPRAPARILVAGSDLLAGALARALEAYGFVTKSVMLREPDIERGIAWRPNLVLIDVRSLEVTCGMTLVSQLRRAGTEVCVIDGAQSGARGAAWTGAGASQLINRSETFDRVLGTITRLLQKDFPPQPVRRSSARLSARSATSRPLEACLDSFSVLTERERFVLAELMEGHSAEEIAKAAIVSISTVRSQIKAVLQKLGVNSQLAAVALARRAGWSPDNASSSPPVSSNYSHVRVS